jgi:hypothetical protein
MAETLYKRAREEIEDKYFVMWWSPNIF